MTDPDVLKAMKKIEESMNEGVHDEQALPEASNAPQPSQPIISDDNQVRTLEAMLFASREPLSTHAMLERLPEGADLHVLLKQLGELYEGRGVSLVEIDKKWAFRTATDIAPALTVTKENTKKMSKATLETMAIIAYHQPVTRAEVENIRGVATHKGTLDTLMEMGWVKPGRRRETPGRPLTWLTTTKFLDHFQLSSINDLPGIKELKDTGLLDARAAIDTIPDTGDLFDDPDVDADEALEAQQKGIEEQRDQDAFDEQSYKEIKKQEL